MEELEEQNDQLQERVRELKKDKEILDLVEQMLHGKLELRMSFDGPVVQMGPPPYETPPIRYQVLALRTAIDAAARGEKEGK